MAPMTIKVALEVRFPDNDIGAAVGRLRLEPGPAQAAWIEAAFEELLVPLRAVGGEADVAAITLSVLCRLPAWSEPVAGAEAVAAAGAEGRVDGTLP